MVFLIWYPSPWRQMLGVAGIFGVVVMVDLVCGPLLTLVLASPKKSKRERWLDLALVACIQLVALGYGLWSVYQVRPVVLAFEVDRFVVVTANEVQMAHLAKAPEGLRALPWRGVNTVGLRRALSPDEFVASLDQSLGGVTPAMRPDWWVPYDRTKTDAAKRAKPLANLIQKQPEHKASLERAMNGAKLTVGELRYLPLTSSKQQDWIVLLDNAGNIVGHAPVDGFD